MSDYKLSPSDFAFLWEECKRCFYLKIVKGFYRPRPMIPKIFSIIDSQIKICLKHRRVEDVVYEVRRGIVKYADEWVESLPIKFADIPSTCFIRGKFDSIVQFDDDTFGVIDFKTAEVYEDHIRVYSRQLHAYAYALENPASGNFTCGPVSALGLIVYEPKEFACQSTGGALLRGELKWLEVPRDNSAFLEFIRDVLTLLDKPDPPDPSSSCEWCRYRENSRVTGL